MLFPFVEFATGLAAASVSAAALKAAVPAATGLALANALEHNRTLEKLDLNQVRDLGTLYDELERRGMSVAEKDLTLADAYGGLRTVKLPVIHETLADFAGEWAVTDVENTLLMFYLGREQVRLGVGKRAANFAFISKATGWSYEDLTSWFYMSGAMDAPTDHFVNGRLGAYLRHLKKVTVPARLRWMAEQQKS